MLKNEHSDKPNLLAGVPTGLLNANTKTTTYDTLGRVTRQTTPLNGEVKSITEYEYDGRGNVTEHRIFNNPDNSSTVTFRLTFIGTMQVATEHSKTNTALMPKEISQANS